MQGASVAGGIEERARAALDAGCDVALACNQPETAGALLQALESRPPLADQGRLVALQAKPHATTLAALRDSEERQQALAALDWIGAA